MSICCKWCGDVNMRSYSISECCNRDRQFTLERKCNYVPSTLLEFLDTPSSGEVDEEMS